jgi:hypothetical protein
MNALAPYENVTVLYGHIHCENFHQAGTTKMYAARSLIFPFPDPANTPEKKPLPFNKAQPFKDLGLRRDWTCSRLGWPQGIHVALDGQV